MRFRLAPSLTRQLALVGVIAVSCACGPPASVDDSLAAATLTPEQAAFVWETASGIEPAGEPVVETIVEGDETITVSSRSFRLPMPAGIGGGRPVAATASCSGRCKGPNCIAAGCHPKPQGGCTVFHCGPGCIETARCQALPVHVSGWTASFEALGISH